MNKKRETKDVLPLENKNNSKVQKKDIEQKEGKKTKEELNEKNSSSDLLKKEKKVKENDVQKKEHQFYTEKENNEKKGFFSKKSSKIGLGVLGVSIIALSLGLGLGLGLKSKEKNGFYFNGIWYSEKDIEQIKKWFEENQNNFEKQIKILSDDSIVWTFETLGEKYLGPSYGYLKEKSEKNADKTIDDEIQAKKDEFGKDWEKEWNKSLIERGYDSQDEYKNSLISSSYKGEIDSLFEFNNLIFNYKLEEDGVTKPNYISDEYHSSIANSSGKYKGITKLEDGQFITKKNDTYYKANSNIVNGEALLNAFLKFYKPISYNDILIPFTIANSKSDGLQLDVELDKRINIGDDVSNLTIIWDLYAKTYLNIETSSEFYIMDPNDFSNTPSNVVSLNSINSSDQSSSLIWEIFLDDYKNDFNDKTFNFADFSSFYSSLKKLEQNEAGDNIYFTDDNLSAESVLRVDQNKDSALKIVFENGKETLNKKIGENLFGTPSNTAFSNSNRFLYSKINHKIPFAYDLFINDNFELKEVEPLGTNEYSVPLFFTFKSDGIHIIYPSIFYAEDDSTTPDLFSTNYEDLFKPMIVSYLDEKIDQNSYKYSDFSSLESEYNSWFTNNSWFLYLNTALNNEEFNNQYLKDEVQKEKIIDALYGHIYTQNIKSYNELVDNYFDFKNKYGFYSEFTMVGRDQFVTLNRNGDSFNFTLNDTWSFLQTGNLYNDQKNRGEE